MAERTLIDVASADDLATGEPVRVEVEGTPVVLVNVAGEVLAVHDVCTHALESLSGGWVEEDRIECPRHGAAFSLRSGEALTPPATLPLPTFAVEVRDGRVLVDPTPSHDHPLIR
ncbi:MAG TPA: non-heme iron oxygenase ferredoxin subunit [Miltoncostaeaceae bacterium]|nr:non-heme iron oxygenase ferredoxin subunit [Miltoncostaeaceae bacterium]